MFISGLSTSLSIALQSYRMSLQIYSSKTLSDIILACLALAILRLIVRNSTNHRHCRVSHSAAVRVRVARDFRPSPSKMDFTCSQNIPSQNDPTSSGDQSLAPSTTNFRPLQRRRELRRSKVLSNTRGSHPLSSDKAVHQTLTERTQTICVACMDDITEEIFEVECGHPYHRACLIALFIANMNEEWNFPPKCCGYKISLVVFNKPGMKNNADAELLRAFEQKALEYSNPSRIYCSNTVCSRYLGGKEEEGPSEYTCACGTRTCAMCSNRAHGRNVKCQVASNVRNALVFAQSQGWQRCPGCKNLVERSQGCRHMTCRCGTHFCYACAQKRSECKCSRDGPGVLRRDNYLLEYVAEYNELNSESPNPRIVHRKERKILSLLKKSWRGLKRTVRIRV